MVRVFGLPSSAPQITPRYNIAPTQFVPVVRLDAQGARALSLLYWGLIPHWAKEKSIGARMINARVETLSEKPSFRTALQRRRCLVLASGYYEWQAAAPEARHKQPYFLTTSNDEPFAMAGLWETWTETPGAAPLESCTIITTEAQGAAAKVHHRMPVILKAPRFQEWLDPALLDVAALQPLLVDHNVTTLEVRAISTRVNNARNEGPELVEPLRATGTDSIEP